MGTSQNVTRRRFISGTTAAVAAPYFLTRQSQANTAVGTAVGTAANDKINIALIGANGQGNWNLDELLKQQDLCQVVAVCEVYKERLDKTLAKVPGATGYHDFRDVLARPDIDAVLIATGPHWHTYMAVAAAEAGKDFYLEKPMSLYPSESKAIVNAANRHQRVTQIGTQVHATDHYRRMVDLVRSGLLGPISVVRAFNVMNQGPRGIGDPPVGEPPAGLDVDLWCGPAPLYYHPLLVQDAYTHCSFMRYTGGWTPGMAPHIIDLPIWALDLPLPSRVSCSGGRYIIKDCGDAYDTHEVIWTYPNLTMTWHTSLTNSYGFDLQGRPGARRRLGVYFHGLDGTLATDYGYHKIIPEGDRIPTTQPQWPEVIPASPGHHREWLTCIRTRQQPSCNVTYHHRVDMPIVLSLLSLRLGRSIEIDPTNGAIVGDAEASRLSTPEYRDPWKFPSKYV